MNLRSLLHASLSGILLLSLSACAPETDHAHEDAHGHGENVDAHDEGEARGPNGGRLLSEGDYAVELKILEAGEPPRYAAWLYHKGHVLAPGQAQLRVRLSRLGGRVDEHVFRVEDEQLRGDRIVDEPHSFGVEVEALIGEQRLDWAYDSFEGRTRITAAMAAASGIEVAAVGAGVIRDEHEVQGLLTPIEGRQARVVARFPGPVRALNAGVGDRVRAGQVLAVVESNISLSDYAITAPFAGTVLARSAAVGEMAGDSPLFEIADLSALWVDLHLFGSDAGHIEAGAPVEITRLSDGQVASTQLERVLPATATASQSTIGRAVLANPDGLWRPGAAVRARITVALDEVPLRVPLSALQRFRDFDVVFIRIGEDYEIRPLELGRRDASHVEVLAGVEAGDQIVVEQSYLVRADIEKAGASHDH